MLRWFAMMGLVLGLVAGSAYAEEAAQETEGTQPAVGAGQETEPAEAAPSEGATEQAPAESTEESPAENPSGDESPSPE
jgi:hypothetical protein